MIKCNALKEHTSKSHFKYKFFDPRMLGPLFCRGPPRPSPARRPCRLNSWIHHCSCLQNVNRRARLPSIPPTTSTQSHFTLAFSQQRQASGGSSNRSETPSDQLIGQGILKILEGGAAAMIAAGKTLFMIGSKNLLKTQLWLIKNQIKY